jgi:dephospho-CoA kinase
MLIALSGKKGSGKDTVAKYFINKGYIRFAFADALKDICKILFNLSDDQLNGYLKETIDQRYNKTPREILQYIGTLMRNNMDNLIPNFGQNIWINVMKNLIDTAINNNTNIIITDLRYKNEYEFLQNTYSNHNLIFINIIRPNQYLSGDYNNHESENDLNNMNFYNYIINNDSTIDQLYYKCAEII